MHVAGACVNHGGFINHPRERVVAPTAPTAPSQRTTSQGVFTTTQVSLKEIRLPPYGNAVGTHDHVVVLLSCRCLILNHRATARQPAPLVEVELADGRTLRTRLLVRACSQYLFVCSHQAINCTIVRV